MRTALDLYHRIPAKYRLHVLACLAGIIILAIFSAMTLFWALKAVLSLSFKLIIGLAICALIFKIRYEFRKRKARD